MNNVTSDKQFRPNSHWGLFTSEWTPPGESNAKYRVNKSVNGSLPRAEVRLQAAEAHNRDLQAGGPDGITCWPEGPRRQKRGAKRGAEGGTQAAAQPAKGWHLGQRGAFALGPWALLIFLNGRKLFHDSSITLTVSLMGQKLR